MFISTQIVNILKIPLIYFQTFLHGPFIAYESQNLFGLCYLVHVLLIIFFGYVTWSIKQCGLSDIDQINFFLNIPNLW